MWTYAVRVFQTSDGMWHLQTSRECESDIQVLRVWTLPRLIECIELASALQLHIDNESELPIRQYVLQSTDNAGRYTLAA